MSDSTSHIINQGIGCEVRAYGSGLVVGTAYTACLYYNANTSSYRATQDAVCALTKTVVSGEEVERPACVFAFTPEQTLQLKAGNVILEIYDKETKQQMSYDDQYARVRKTSLIPTNDNN